MLWDERLSGVRECNAFFRKILCSVVGPELLNGLIRYIRLLKPTGHVMHHQFKTVRSAPHCIYVFCVYLRTNSDLCHLQHKLIGFYNPDGKCLQRGTHWGFK